MNSVEKSSAPLNNGSSPKQVDPLDSAPKSPWQQLAQTISSSCRSVISQHSCKLVAWVGLVCLLGWISKRLAPPRFPIENVSESFKTATHLALTALDVPGYDMKTSPYATKIELPEDKVPSFQDRLSPILKKYSNLREESSPFFSTERLRKELNAVIPHWFRLKTAALAAREWPALRDRLVPILDAGNVPLDELHQKLNQECNQTKQKIADGITQTVAQYVQDLTQSIADGSLWLNMSLFEGGKTL